MKSRIDLILTLNGLNDWFVVINENGKPDSFKKIEYKYS